MNEYYVLTIASSYDRNDINIDLVEIFYSQKHVIDYVIEHHIREK